MRTHHLTVEQDRRVTGIINDITMKLEEDLAEYLDDIFAEIRDKAYDEGYKVGYETRDAEDVE